MKPVLTPKQMAALEQKDILGLGVPSVVLMDRAAKAVAQETAAYVRPGGSVLVLCGPGNNGGDGYWAALHLTRMGVKVKVVAFAPSKDDALTGRIALEKLGIAVQEHFDGTEGCDAVIDALFGTGFHGALEGEYLRAAQCVNASGLPVAAVDIPSGVDGATGQIAGEAIRATCTVTFACQKIGHLIYPGRALCGRIVTADIGIGQPEEAVWEIEPGDIGKNWLAPRPRDGHKGTFGHAALIVGSRGMAGAAVLASLGAIKGGAGLVSVGACETSVAPIVQQNAFEAMAWPLRETEGAISPENDFDAFLRGKSALGFGCGFGRSDFARQVVKKLVCSDLPMVMDADALFVCENQFGKNCVITPHPGEMARLCGKQTAEILADPIGIARDFAQKHGIVVLLKGASTVIAAPDGRVRINTTGTPAMATGGSGDVLTGVITALLAQGLTPFDAASAGACLHGLAGLAAEKTQGEIGVAAREIAQHLGSAFETAK